MSSVRGGPRRPRVYRPKHGDLETHSDDLPWLSRGEGRCEFALEVVDQLGDIRISASEGQGCV